MNKQKLFESEKAQQELEEIRGWEVESVYIGYIKNGKAVQQNYNVQLKDFIPLITQLYGTKTDKLATFIYGKCKYFFDTEMYFELSTDCNYDMDSVEYIINIVISNDIKILKDYQSFI